MSPMAICVCVFWVFVEFKQNVDALFVAFG